MPSWKLRYSCPLNKDQHCCILGEGRKARLPYLISELCIRLIRTLVLNSEIVGMSRLLASVRLGYWSRVFFFFSHPRIVIHRRLGNYQLLLTTTQPLRQRHTPNLLSNRSAPFVNKRHSGWFVGIRWFSSISPGLVSFFLGGVAAVKKTGKVCRHGQPQTPGSVVFFLQICREIAHGNQLQSRLSSEWLHQ